VSRADEIVQQFDQKLAASGILIATKEAALNERLAKAQAAFENEVRGARDSAINAQRDAMASLNTELRSIIDQVERPKNDSAAQIEKAAKAVNGTRDDAVKSSESRTKEKLIPDLDEVGVSAIAALNGEGDTQRGRIVNEAQRIITSLKEPSIRNVLGRAFWLLVVSVAVSVLSLFVALVAWRKSLWLRSG
jgi:molecular chaperone GrpE (heat shock protein)